MARHQHRAEREPEAPTCSPPGRLSRPAAPPTSDRSAITLRVSVRPVPLSPSPLVVATTSMALGRRDWTALPRIAGSLTLAHQWSDRGWWHPTTICSFGCYNSTWTSAAHRRARWQAARSAAELHALTTAQSERTDAPYCPKDLLLAFRNTHGTASRAACARMSTIRQRLVPAHRLRVTHDAGRRRCCVGRARAGARRSRLPL
jgi:hypothetical protein